MQKPLHNLQVIFHHLVNGIFVWERSEESVLSKSWSCLITITYYYCRIYEIKFLVRQVLQAVFALRSDFFTTGLFLMPVLNLSLCHVSLMSCHRTGRRPNFLILLSSWKKAHNWSKELSFALQSKKWQINDNTQRNILSLKTSQPGETDLPVKCKKKKSNESPKHIIISKFSHFYTWIPVKNAESGLKELEIKHSFLC